MNRRYILRIFTLMILPVCLAHAQNESASPRSKNSDVQRTVGALIKQVRSRANTLENTSGMRSSFQSFTRAYKINPATISYSDFVIARMLYEATRDAGFWNLHWTITDMPPNSDQVWKQWKSVKTVSPALWTASAECDELSAVYSFLVERAGVRSVGLFWPYPNHTVGLGDTPVEWRRSARGRAHIAGLSRCA